MKAVGSLSESLKIGRKKRQPLDPIVVPRKVHLRARKALALGAPATWIDQCLFLVGQNVTHHEPGDGLLDEAIQGAESLLALLVEMKERETL